MPTSFSFVLGSTDLDEVRQRYLSALAALDEELAELEAQEGLESVPLAAPSSASEGDRERPAADGQ